MNESANPARAGRAGHWLRLTWLCLAVASAPGPLLAQAPAAAAAPHLTDYIVAVVNQELVTAVELEKRMAQVREQSTRSRQPQPSAEALRQRVLDVLIDERAVLSYARESGLRVDEAELDRAVASIMAQNQLSEAEFRRRLKADGMDVTRFRAELRDQILIERTREQAVQARTTITDKEIEAYLEKQRISAAANAEHNIAQILVQVPDGASDDVVAQKKALAEDALARVRAGEDFAKVARAVSEDANKNQGGEIGLRPASRLPDLFVETVRPLKDGEVAPALLRSGAGFHVLKLVERRDGATAKLTQTRARHILLRPSAQLSPDTAMKQMARWRLDIEAGKRRFEDLAREHSEDGSAAKGGDLGWAGPGQFVPEFEKVVQALPVGGLSEPLTTRFGVHLIQVIDRRTVAQDNKQLREQARNRLREEKYDAVYAEWVQELRHRSYIEMREPPQ